MTTQLEADFAFKAEIKQLLHILVHSLYKEREIFLRELISNASDALTRLHFETLTNTNIFAPETPLEIRINPLEKDGEKWLVVQDSGIGMSYQELVQNLGTIAQSGAREFMTQVSKGEAKIGEIIGQFGVGFYSLFMVADEVRVVSRSYRPEDEAAAWISQGGDTFHVEPAEKSTRGTEIQIKLKADADEFSQSWKLRQIIKKHSDFVGYPIYIGDEQVNQQQSLWRRPAGEVTAEEYKKFYEQMTLDFEEPLAKAHFISDAPVDVRALLFVPSRRDRGVLATRKEPGLKLYSHNVLIQEYCPDLLPKWLDFVDGVVDSEDLPLNVSRETVQNNRLMRQLSKTIRRRVLRALTELADKESDKYKTFWEQYGRPLKEGLATDPEAKEEILPLLRFYSSNSANELTSLESYTGRMAENQSEIYYIFGDDLKSVARSPHLDIFKAHNLEVLYWVDPLDAFIAPLLAEYNGKKLRNVDDAGLELPKSEEEEANLTSDLPEADFNRFVGRCVTALGDKIVEVRASKVLKDSPVRLVSPEDTQNREMQRIARLLDQKYEVPKKILEINRNHPLIGNLARLVSSRPELPLINLAIEQLYDNALVQEGLHPNPAEMLPRIQQLLELAAAK